MMIYWVLLMIYLSYLSLSLERIPLRSSGSTVGLVGATGGVIGFLSQS